jgi:transcriptional regulator with XRE-family HTH domain
MNSVNPHSTKIGNKLRQLRINKGYSQEYMAEILAVSQKTYSNMENDKTSISIEALKKIAEEYRVNILKLLSDEKIMVQQNNFLDLSSKQEIIYNHITDELINQLKSRIEDLKNSLAEKEKYISTLEKLLLK